MCSLRVSLDLGKVVYSWMITRDSEMPGTTVRSSTIPEELGRVAYLLTDKTGTLTQNEMVCNSCQFFDINIMTLMSTTKKPLYRVRLKWVARPSENFA